MPLASVSQRRTAFRAFLAANEALPAGSVFDAASARLAQAAGYRVGMFAGSVASAVVLGAPDLVVMTLSEFAEQARRIARGSDLPFMVDADHGYGNALNVRRTVEELETAGVSAIAVEDTVLPRAYAGPEAGLISRDEFRDKLRSSVAARMQPELVIIGRTQALRDAGMDETLARIAICNETGVDAIFVVGINSIEQVRSLHEATSLPLILNAMPADGTPETVAALGARLYLQGHLPYYAALNTLYESYKHLVETGDQKALQAKVLSKELQALALDEAGYAAWTREYMGVDK
jgi:carboxyvinyl-carboxyphosphonate phosphorylmutase